ncbi:hypothetical protein ANO14919_034490 [Xylariales sp. No.14919]|nr:hypothetical protein ANO14919_034490 [Xylariales sp. No.14919]
MPTQPELVQPWREWYDELMSSTPKTSKAITMKDEDGAGMNPVKYGMSQHGTIALDPREDVDLSKEKVKPVRK